MAGKYRNPSYRQYMPQDMLEELRAISKATNRPMQQIVRVAVRRFLAELRQPAAVANPGERNG